MEGNLPPIDLYNAPPVMPWRQFADWIRMIAGVWIVLASEWSVMPAFTCAKHTPPDRPPKYWSVVLDTVKPTPYVPIHEPFELEG